MVPAEDKSAESCVLGSLIVTSAEMVPAEDKSAATEVTGTA
jgi:hypothetical protein